MRKRALLLALLCFVCASSIYYASAAGGGAEDPLISLSYLNGPYTELVMRQVASLRGGATPATPPAPRGWTEMRLKEGDALAGSTGALVMALAGEVTVQFSSGAVVDVTTATEVASGSRLEARHRYLVAEDTGAVFSVAGKTAVLNSQGPSSLRLSEAVDYNAMARALKDIGLFRGSLTGYGDGFDLEVAPTRLQALIMFVRLLGEEEEALAYTGSTPFTDIEPGSEPAKYVGYAYSRGYTNGYTTTTFRPGQKVNAYQYVEFVLRAMGYSDTGNTDLSGTLERAADSGVLTAGERAMLARDPFLRAELVYVSWQALSAPVAGSGQTLGQTLSAKGVFTQAEYLAAGASVGGRVP